MQTVTALSCHITQYKVHKKLHGGTVNHKFQNVRVSTEQTRKVYSVFVFGAFCGFLTLATFKTWTLVYLIKEETED